MKTIGVLGAGVMGTGVAHALAESGHRVILNDVSEEQLRKARQNIRKNLRMYRLLQARASGAPTGADANDAETLGRIETTTELAPLRAADFIVENVTEKWEIKQELHARLDQLDMPPVPVAVNTSAIPMARFAALYSKPGRIVGMHFMNPVPLMPMIEVIRGEATAEDTLGAAKQLTTQMRRQCIVVKDSPGFVTNRVMMLTVNEAVFLLHEGVASAEDIDRLFQTCFNHRMGPLATADLIGVDTVLYSIEVLHREFKDDKYRPCPLFQQMVDQGLLGRKSGRGFYQYDV
ncbi:3-hydroxyacyl-CoA dehydrogenase NAD-binding domain-containing protein [Polyangium sp. 6x1]|uniref:3-hydroxyacyl-CoA dehydrogenase family protein n=1 Tax=Polyangium sp. 6x1 TaxID=3042689 RepID=UPI00248232AE|nr:3-hydroxyacyl-CoA dehydrogenase NAD-binding domain-containing protein [Polyangium sp. 6x1]MDI1443048.1 3-hydroxyacyl-CoA dehydrogenase NAD-binding domain-containing protein [Polyangium sp. 6x1]